MITSGFALAGDAAGPVGPRFARVADPQVMTVAS